MNARIPKDKYFYIKTKEEMVEVMKEPVKGALHFTLDLLFDAIDREGADFDNPKEDDSPSVKQYRISIATYQKLLDKLTKGEDLEPVDFDLITLVCQNTNIQMQNQIQGLKLASQELSKIAWKIVHNKFNTDKSTEIMNGIEKNDLEENK